MMAISPPWWRGLKVDVLNDIIADVNHARDCEYDIGRCGSLCNAFNQLFSQHYLVRKRDGDLAESKQQCAADGERPKDTANLRKLLRALPQDEQTAICQSESLKQLANLRPLVLDQGLLEEREYDPSNLDDELREQAQLPHRRLCTAHQEYLDKLANKPSASTKSVMENLGTLIYTIRSNLKHGGKTRHGPDAKKGERDNQVCHAAVGVMEDLAEAILDHPSRRLVVYGTLAPGEANHAVIAEVPGEWNGGVVQGKVEIERGLPTFIWTTAEELSVQVLESDDLPNHWERLDNFEGAAYKRRLIPIRQGDGWSVGNIYFSTAQNL